MNLNMLRTLLALITLFSAFACNKPGSNDHSMPGKVLDYSTYAAIPGTNVILFRADGVNPLSPLGLTNPVSNSAVSDANGNFSVTFDASINKTYYTYDANKTGYIYIQPDFIARPIFNSRRDPIDTIYIDKISILDIMMNNIAPAGANDTLALSIVHSRHTGNGIYRTIRKDRTLTGIINNSNFRDTFSVKEYPILKLSWTVRNNGVLSTGEQTIIPVEFSTTNYSLNY